MGKKRLLLRAALVAIGAQKEYGFRPFYDTRRKNTNLKYVISDSKTQVMVDRTTAT